MKYSVEKISSQSSNTIFRNVLYQLPKLHIDNYIWLHNGYEPKVEVSLCYTNEALYILFQVHEKEVKAKYVKYNDPVHKDSCVEFFINPFPKYSRNYLNFEVNAIGTLHIGFGESREREVLSLEEIKRIEVFSSLTGPLDQEIDEEKWEIKMKIPLILLETTYKRKFKGEDAKANFYKCGDETKTEHYGCWNPILNDKPDFHLPDFFGSLIFDDHNK